MPDCRYGSHAKNICPAVCWRVSVFDEGSLLTAGQIFSWANSRDLFFCPKCKALVFVLAVPSSHLTQFLELVADDASNHQLGHDRCRIAALPNQS